MRILLILLPAASLLAADWPAWRGPTGNGVTTETDLPQRFSASEGVRWKTALSEPGNSTPIISSGRVFLTQPDGARRTLMCFDRADGRLLWQRGPSVTGEEPTHKTNPYCAASAVTDGKRVIAWFGRAGLWCWDFDGNEQWRLDLGEQSHIWGYAASPVLADGLCLLNFGPGPRSFVIAVEAATGKERWRFDVPAPAAIEGPGDPAKDFIGSWNTGILADITGRREYLISLPGAVWSLDPATGKPHWHCNGLNPLSYADPIVTPAAILGFGGFSGYSIGIRPGGTGDITATHRLWQEKKNPQRIGSGVFHGAHAYLTSEPGIIECLDPATGKAAWKQRMEPPNGRASSWSSLTLSGDRIYTLTQSGDVIVFRASPEKYEQLAANTLGDGVTNSSIAPSNGQLFLRTRTHLWCIGK